jgi:O-antigen/teichoic acid export membrane protein
MDKRFTSNLIKGLASTSFGSVATIGFHFLSILLMTRYVPKDVLGVFFLALAVVQVLKIVGGLGLDLTLAKSVSGVDRQMQQNTVGSIVAIRFLSVSFLGLIFYLAGRFMLPVFDARLSDCIVFMILLFALTSYRDLFLGLMQGVQQFKEYAVVEVLSAVTRVILLIAFHDRLSLQSLLSIEIISQAIEILLQLFAMRALLIGLSRKNINREFLQSIFQFSTPLYLNNLLAVVHDRGNVFLIGAFLNPVSVAAFEVARKIPDGFQRLFDSFIVVYFPSLSSLFAKGKHDDAKRIMNSSLVLLSAGIMFLVLVGFLFANEIILALFSKEYLEVSLAFALLMLNFCLRAISNILGYSLVSAGYSSAPVKANIVAVTVNMVSSFILIRIFGYIGAVYSLLLMNITTQIIYGLLLRQARLTPHMLEYLKPFFLLAVMIGIYRLFGTGSNLLKLLLIGLYGGACWILIKEIRESLHAALEYVSTSKVGILIWQARSRMREDVSKD